MYKGFPGGPGVKNPTNAREMSSVPGLGIFHMLQNNETRAPQLLNPRT